MEDKTTFAGFAPGEAERLATKLRTCLRRGDQRGAQTIYEQLAQRLKRFVDQQAHGYFDRRSDLVEDGFAEAMLGLWQRLSDLRDMPGLKHWEIRFHQALSSLLSDSFGRVLRQSRDKQEVAASGLADDTNDEAPTAILERQADPQTEQQIAGILNGSVLAEIPPKHARALLLWADGYTREEIAAQLQCSSKSAYNWMESARQALRDHFPGG